MTDRELLIEWYARSKRESLQRRQRVAQSILDSPHTGVKAKSKAQFTLDVVSEQMTHLYFNAERMADYTLRQDRETLESALSFAKELLSDASDTLQGGDK